MGRDDTRDTGSPEGWTAAINGETVAAGRFAGKRSRMTAAQKRNALRAIGVRLADGDKPDEVGIPPGDPSPPVAGNGLHDDSGPD